MAKYLDATGLAYLWIKIKSYVQNAVKNLSTNKLATTSAPGLMSANDKKKLSNLAACVKITLTHENSEVEVEFQDTDSEDYISTYIEGATEKKAGVMTAAQVTTLNKLNGMFSVNAINLTGNVIGIPDIVGASNSGKQQTIIYYNNSTAVKTVTVPTAGIKTPDGKEIVLQVPVGGYAEVNFINIGGTIFARAL
ncbi:MAG: hypothetical protein J1E37_04205 [Prevotella sp.]|nr:hypothetical protein [Prevotella sp.]